ncbi:histone H2A [Medusavirus stheno T3]|uniref:Histone H2A n=1 Tax=Medusavirus stheno T3 TaxID=3069717 RepID=A0A7S8BEN2_9VIRU|nr:histone H2A [Acanthamoeba castellanii medusavirus]QPB44482.1 histone H2A [Medusavirus stheno T3]
MEIESHVQPAEVLAAASESMQLEEQTQLPAFVAGEALEELQTEGKKTSPAKKRSAASGKNVKRANERAGLKLPPGRIQKIIKSNQTVDVGRSSPTASVFLTAVIEDIVKHIIVGADKKSAERGRIRISPQDINKYLTEDGEAYMRILGDAFVAHGGVGQVADAAVAAGTKKRKRAASGAEGAAKKAKKATGVKPKKTIKKVVKKKSGSAKSKTAGKSVTKKTSTRKASA